MRRRKRSSLGSCNPFVSISVSVACAALLLFADAAAASGGRGYDPKAKAFLQEVLSAYAFRPFAGAAFGSFVNIPHRFGPARTKPADRDVSAARARELYERLKRAEFELVDPLEKADDIGGLRTYRELKRRCAGYPAAYWDVPLGKEELPGAMHNPLGPSVSSAPYVPGKPRPVDYESAQVSSYAAVATEGFALYRIPEAGSGESDLYVLRAEEYRVPTKSGFLYEESKLPGSVAAFEHPSCIFRASLDFTTRYEQSSLEAREFDREMKDVMVHQRVKGEYLGEIVKIDEAYYVIALSLFIRDETKEQNVPEYWLQIWELGFNESPYGKSYLMTTRPET